MLGSIHKKTINNAISAYLMLIISVAFLFNRDNEYLNNSFVKSHTKIAFLIHISFLINYIIFISFSFLKEYSILEYSINYILASSIFCILFLALLYWIYKASKGEVFKIWDLLTLGKTEKIVDVDGNAELDEKDKFTLILAQIPFIWYIIHGKFLSQKSIKDIVFVNMFVSIIISLIFIITLLLIIILVLNYFYILPSNFALLLLFPITFGLWYIDSRPAYKMPYIYEIFETLVKIKNIFKKSKANIAEKKAEEHIETHTVWKKDDSINSLYNKKD